MQDSITRIFSKVDDPRVGNKTVVKIIAQNNVTTSQSRFYISSEEQDEAFYNVAVRGHWSIENHLHWHLVLHSTKIPIETEPEMLL